MNHVLHPSKVGVAFRRYAILPTRVINKLVMSPHLQVERWICHDKICPKRRMLVICECVGSLTEIAFKTSDSQVHLTHLPCRSVILLTIYRYIPHVLLMALHKLCRLNEHTSRTTGRVVYSSAIWLQDFNNRTHDARRSIELTGVLSLL